jgi:hypothetical protein
LVREGGGLADDEMALQTDSIDLDASGFERSDEVLDSGCFGSGIFDVVVVVIKFYGWVVESSGFESDGDVFWTDCVVKLRRALAFGWFYYRKKYKKGISEISF